jgi:hypothetical protein
MHRSKAASSFDHLVGSGEQRGQDGETDSLGCLEIDDEFKFRGLLYRQLRRFRPAE